MATITETIEIDMGPAARKLDAFAALLETHAAAFRADLKQLMAAESEGGEGER